ncbi:hypothetical protein RUM43_011243, partial [Polyplax serrata]
MDVIVHEASQQRDTSENIEMKSNGSVSNGTSVTNISKMDPVDLEFRNVLFRASIGFRK